MAVAKQLQGREVAMKENVAVTRKIFVSTIDDAIRIRTCKKARRNLEHATVFSFFKFSINGSGLSVEKRMLRNKELRG
jgi:hypothetical protein